MTGETLIIMPAYNEARGIGRVVSAIRAAYPELPLAVIDDGSRDGTGAAARAAGAQVVSHPFNMHYGSALFTGYRLAIARGCDRVVQVDADGQHDPASIRTVLHALEDGADLVLGSRFLDPESYSPPPIRRIGMTLFSLAASAAVGSRIADATTGCQGLSRRLLEFYTERAHFPHDYPDANMIVRTARAGFRIVEVPARMHTAEEGGGMHVGWKPFWYVFKMSVAIVVESSRRLEAGA